jgi:hypothetical protein
MSEMALARWSPGMKSGRTQTLNPGERMKVGGSTTPKVSWSRSIEISAVID